MSFEAHHEQHASQDSTWTEAANGIGKAAHNVETASDRIINILKIMAFMMFVKFIIVVGIAMLVQRNSSNNSDTQDQVDEVQVSVNHLEDFVDRLESEEATPEETAQMEAIIRAVQIVPVLLQIACEANPEVPSCQGV